MSSRQREYWKFKIEIELLKELLEVCITFNISLSENHYMIMQ